PTTRWSCSRNLAVRTSARDTMDPYSVSESFRGSGCRVAKDRKIHSAATTTRNQMAGPRRMRRTGDSCPFKEKAPFAKAAGNGIVVRGSPQPGIVAQGLDKAGA